MGPRLRIARAGRDRGKNPSVSRGRSIQRQGSKPRLTSRGCCCARNEQQLRAKAQAAGTLADTPQEQVQTDDGQIEIEPTNADAIYMPEYDPNEVYADDYSPAEGALIAYGPAWPVGPWLIYGFDWRHRRFYSGEWRRGWDARGRGAFTGANIVNGRLWRPNPNRGRHDRFFTTTQG